MAGHRSSLLSDAGSVENIDGWNVPLHHTELIVLPQDEETKNCQQVGEDEGVRQDLACPFPAFS